MSANGLIVINIVDLEYIAQQAIQTVQDRFKLAHGEEVAHASLHLIEKLDGPHVGDLPFDLWKANCALVLTCVAKQQK